MGRYSKTPGWEVGMYAQITGDTRFDHERPVGTLVQLCVFDQDDDTWEVREVDNPEHMSAFWCRTSELELAPSEPTDEEIAVLFGLTATKPCATCGCSTNGKH